jgi:hypothetical protein
MPFRRVKKFSSSLTKGLLPSQHSTFFHIVSSMIVCPSLCLAELAPCLNSNTDFRHNLKRVWRFVSNDRINDRASKEVIARRLIRQLLNRLQLKPDQVLEIIIDWTTVWPFQLLQALIPLDGRAVPVLSWSALRGSLTLRQNTI